MHVFLTPLELQPEEYLYPRDPGTRSIEAGGNTTGWLANHCFSRSRSKSSILGVAFGTTYFIIVSIYGKIEVSQLEKDENKITTDEILPSLSSVTILGTRNNI